MEMKTNFLWLIDCQLVEKSSTTCGRKNAVEMQYDGRAVGRKPMGRMDEWLLEAGQPRDTIIMQYEQIILVMGKIIRRRAGRWEREDPEQTGQEKRGKLSAGRRTARTEIL